MSDVDAHVRKWARHKAGAAACAVHAPPQADAAVILTFYAALHLTQGYLSAKGERFDAENHGARRAAIHRAPELGRPFRTVYRELQELSESARYDVSFDTSAVDVANATAWLHTVEAFLVPKLRTKGVAVP